MSRPAAARPIAYRRRASPLHAARATVAACYGCALAACALILSHPLLLGALLVAVLAAAAAAGVGRELARAARRACLPIVALTVLVNVLVSRSGLTVFARLGDWGVLGQVNLTLEAAVYGVVLALRLLAVTLACMLIVCAADPDELLASLRRISPRSALTAALSTRLIPTLLEDSRRLAEAQRCRPGADARRTRTRLAILRTTVSAALDRSLDLAAVLEMRGYGARRGSSVLTRPWSRHDAAFGAAAVALVCTALLLSLGHVVSFRAYPLLSIALGPRVLIAAALLCALALAPFSGRRGIAR